MINKLKFHNMLFLMFSIFVAVLLIVSGSAFYSITVGQIEKSAADNQLQTTVKVKEQIYTMLNDMDRMTIAVNASDAVMSTLQAIPEDTSKNYFDFHPTVNGAVKNILYSVLTMKSLKARIKLISRYYDYTGLSTQYDKDVDKSYLMNSTDYKQLMASSPYKVYAPPHEDPWTYYNNNVFSVQRPLRDSYANVFGLVEISIPASELDKLTNIGNNGQRIDIAILDGQGRLIYSNDTLTNETKSVFENIKLNSDIGSTVIAIKGTSLIASYSKMDDPQWTIIQFQDMKIYSQPITNVRNVLIATYVSVFLFLLLILYFFIKAITRPVRQLTQIVKNADIINPNVTMKDQRMHNEIVQMGKAFQTLLDSVRESSRELIDMRSREMNTQMLAMQAQLNPHFIYNTLSVIGAYGLRSGNGEIAEMCTDLSRMLRYTVDFKLGSATIASEISHVQSYLLLMNKRYEGLLEYSIKVEEGLENIIVPKLILQPIVENCFIHGFLNSEYPWKIWIRAYIDGGEWRITVRDNGVGFADEDYINIQEILQKAEDRVKPGHEGADDEKGGIGLINTFIRMKYHYAGREYLCFRNSEGDGAEILIGGPMP